MKFKDIDEAHQEVSADFKISASGKKVPVQRKVRKDDADDTDDKKEDEKEVMESTHRVSVTVTDPHHPASTMRSVKHEKIIRVNSDSKETAVQSAVAHYEKRGYKVHDQNYIGVHTEEVEQVEEGTGNLKPGWMLKADPKLAAALKAKIDLAKKRQATYGNKDAGKSVKEEVEQIDELSKGTLRSYIDKKSDDHESNKNAVADARDALRKHQRNKPSLDAPLKHQFDHSDKKRELEKDVNAASKIATRSNVNILKAKKRLNKEEVELEEAVDKEDMRLLQLARLGLVDKSDVSRLRLAVQQLKSDKTLSIVQRNLLLRVLEDLMSLVTGDDQIFMRIKRDVQKEETDKDDLPFDGPYKKEPPVVKDKSGAVHTMSSRVKHLARLALQKQMQKQKQANK